MPLLFSWQTCVFSVGALLGSCLPVGERMGAQRTDAGSTAAAGDSVTDEVVTNESDADESALFDEITATEWFGIIGTGQSLSVGAMPVNATVNEQPFHNLMLSLDEPTAPPFDAASSKLSLVALKEPQRALAGRYPGPYPTNLYGETPHGTMAAQVSALVEAELDMQYVTIHSVVGESGQGMVALKKGANTGDPLTGRAYAASMFEVEAIHRLVTRAGRRYEVGAITMTHGETDAGNANYEAELVQLHADYNQDVRALTGQTRAVPMIVSQQHAFGFTEGARSGASASTLALWRVAANHPGDFLCSGPKYHYPYDADGVHLTSAGYEMLGEKYGQVYFESVVMERTWRPLEPLSATRDGATVRVRFHVPVAPLLFDDTLPAPHSPGSNSDGSNSDAPNEWQAGRGFELRSGNTPLAIETVSIEGDTIVLTASSDVPASAVVAYALTSDGVSRPGHGHRLGQLRDSDPFVGVVTQKPQPNFAVAFELTLE